jgi:hypothetical protein
MTSRTPELSGYTIEKLLSVMTKEEKLTRKEIRQTMKLLNSLRADYTSQHGVKWLLQNHYRLTFADFNEREYTLVLHFKSSESTLQKKIIVNIFGKRPHRPTDLRFK